MLAANDPLWGTLKGGYRLPLDPRPLIRELETNSSEEAWDRLWDELHHQGDVGDASYAAVPLLVEAHRKRGVAEWNTYAIVSIIELARTERGNPDVPAWLSDEYFEAIRKLSKSGICEIAEVDDLELVRAILGTIALSKGLRTQARFLINYADDELQEFKLK
jgi:hypothetical protein